MDDFDIPEDPLGTLLGEECFGLYDEVQATLLKRYDPRHNTLRCTLPGDKGDIDVGVGTFEVVSIAELRQRVEALGPFPEGAVGRSVGQVEQFIQDVHASAEEGTVIQVASQLNCLEFANSRLTPEDGLGVYLKDKTQGPACALSCLGATAYRTYLVPMTDNQRGQRTKQQVDLSEGLHAELLKRLPHQTSPGIRLWVVRNGYLRADPDYLAAANEQLQDSFQKDWTDLVGAMRVGVQTDAEVTLPRPSGRRVTQVFTSAVPISPLDANPQVLAPIATVFLAAAYEAVFLVAALEAQRLNRQTTVYTTQVGGGAFGNPPSWIEAAKKKARASTLRVTPMVQEMEVVMPPRTMTPKVANLMTDYAATATERQVLATSNPAGNQV